MSVVHIVAVINRDQSTRGAVTAIDASIVVEREVALTARQADVLGASVAIFAVGSGLALARIRTSLVRVPKTTSSLAIFLGELTEAGHAVTATDPPGCQ